MPIRLLSPDVASQIAAGEVVERPASVVKELLENALDAGAQFIRMNIEGAGQRVIEVADDGSGIPASELPLAVERHATSKLSQADDLFHITTLGFRGEALASIGSVSRLTLTSRRAQDESGAILHVEGGALLAVENAGVPIGTVVRVEDLFYNVPARLKFLKHEATERRHIDHLVGLYAIAYPRVRFHLRQEGQYALQTSGQGDRREVLASIYDVDTARQMLEVNFVDRDLRVEGFVSPASLTRSNRREMHFFVNGRPVQDAALATALLQAYRTFLMVGRYPLAILFVDVPADTVDVNVHPAKAEVRFRQPERIFSGLQGAVRRALLAHTPVQGLETSLPRWGEEEGRPTAGRAPGLAWDNAGQERTRLEREYPDLPPMEAQEAGQPGASPAGLGMAATPQLPEIRPAVLRLVGQIALTYLVAEGPDGLYLIDQHAAHERVLYEQFMARHEQASASQVLLTPALVDLPPASARLLSGQLPLLKHIGFDVEAFGAHSFLVRALPALVASSDPAGALRVVVEDFEEDEAPLQAQAEARLIARVCKRAAVKAGQSLSPVEQQALLSGLEACESPRTCPHGRPTMIHISVDLLERQFGRRGAR